MREYARLRMGRIFVVSRESFKAPHFHRIEMNDRRIERPGHLKNRGSKYPRACLMYGAAGAMRDATENALGANYSQPRNRDDGKRQPPSRKIVKKSQHADLDDMGSRSHTGSALKPELRAIVKAEVRRRMASSALESFPKLRLATEKDPALGKETAKLIFDILEKLTADVEPGGNTLQVSIEALPGAPLESSPVIDPKTKLDLVATPDERYRERTGKREKPNEFLKRVWGRLTKHHLLYSEHLRRVDPHLYFALNYEAMTQRIHLAEHLFNLGVMTKAELNHAPKGFERQAHLLRGVRGLLKSQALERCAREELSSRNR